MLFTSLVWNLLRTIRAIFEIMHGAPPFLRATLAREVNQKMMGKLLFGNVGGDRTEATPSQVQSGRIVHP
jgi:hypothetical protein